jgi:3-oxoadipate enol-lactonase
MSAPQLSPPQMVERRVDTALGSVSFASGGDGTDLFLFHSLLSDRNVFDRVLPALAAQHTVHIVDLPGYRESTLVAPRIEAYGDIAAALIREGGFSPRPALLGNGFGAFVALACAIGHGDLIGRLVLAGVGATFPPEARPAFGLMAGRAGEGGMEAVVDIAVRRIFSEVFLEENPAELAERRDVLVRTPVAAFTNACRILESLDLVAAAPAVKNPVLIVVGSDDQATTPAMGRQLHDLLVDSRYVELPGVAHGPQLQDPAGFAAVVGPFLGMSRGG